MYREHFVGCYTETKQLHIGMNVLVYNKQVDFSLFVQLLEFFFFVRHFRN